jgi:hypothetical protein
MHRLILAMLIVATLSCLVVPVMKARAHTITWPDGQSFTFDPTCCNQDDCGAIPLSAFKEVKGGWQVDYTAFFYGKNWRFFAFIPHGDRAVKFNPFADRAMACGSLMNGDLPGTLRPRCIYPIQPSM